MKMAKGERGEERRRGWWEEEKDWGEGTRGRRGGAEWERRRMGTGERRRLRKMGIEPGYSLLEFLEG